MIRKEDGEVGVMMETHIWIDSFGTVWTVRGGK